jgi:hypothetical protein
MMRTLSGDGRRGPVFRHAFAVATYLARGLSALVLFRDRRSP